MLVFHRKDISHISQHSFTPAIVKALNLGYAMKMLEVDLSEAIIFIYSWSYSPPFFLPTPTFSLSTKEIESRSESLGLFDTLKGNPQAFYNHMTKYVLPTVEGTDQGRLLYYYTLLEAAGCEPYVTTTIKPESHVKLLKKLRAVASGKNSSWWHC